jgi:metallo-beta-lactamase class B
MEIGIDKLYSKQPLQLGSLPPIGDLTPIEPTRLFDNFYFVGTRSVGALVIDTGDGLLMIDSGWGETDCSQFTADIKKLGLNPGNIKLILLSHEHLDHYGGVQYLQREVCPQAKVAISTIAWNYLQARPAEPEGAPYSNPRPRSIDIFLTDGQKIALGNTEVRIVATPGHTPGCVSFIIPVTDRGVPHMAGIMGGTLLNPNRDWAYLYKSSIEYFQKFTREAKCDAGLAVHPWGFEVSLAMARVRKPEESNPLVIGTKNFETVYLQYFRGISQETLEKLPPETLPPLKKK